MKLTVTICLGSLLFVGCASSRVATPMASPYPHLAEPLDVFCRNPKDGVFLLPSSCWRLGDVVIADRGGVRLGRVRDGILVSTNRGSFRSELPTSGTMETIPLGKSEEEMVELLGPPTRIWYDLFPIVDAVVPLTLVFGRDTKCADYYLFTTLPSSEVVEMTINVWYRKDAKGHWSAMELRWRIEGTRDLKDERERP